MAGGGGAAFVPVGLAAVLGPCAALLARGGAPVPVIGAPVGTMLLVAGTGTVVVVLEVFMTVNV